MAWCCGHSKHLFVRNTIMSNVIKDKFLCYCTCVWSCSDFVRVHVLVVCKFVHVLYALSVCVRVCVRVCVIVLCLACKESIPANATAQSVIHIQANTSLANPLRHYHAVPAHVQRGSSVLGTA